ncbi:MFS general substrate transporter [Pluteus cervinus]|uniref:MFS general substrate transporter n=1 Tax=Pluteus cervinus TaxID=181527 RepID=A0ACD3ATS1_9AGAR|nr:MFS general substrate transporter [Pluteus cervinus]
MELLERKSDPSLSRHSRAHPTNESEQWSSLSTSGERTSTVGLIGEYHTLRTAQAGRDGQPADTQSSSTALNTEPSDSGEFKLPDLPSLLVVVLGNALAQVTFFIIVSSASAYADHLRGSATFSGLTIGIPTVFAGLALIPMVRNDQGCYSKALKASYVSMIIGNILYALAYRANWLYLILIGRIIAGFGFTSFMYSKRYCSDPRIVGIRRRTTLASCLVLGQGFGFSAGPFLGGLLFRIGFRNPVFNGYTSPGWVMAGTWILFGLASTWLFKEVAKPHRAPERYIPSIQVRTATVVESTDDSESTSPTQANFQLEEAEVGDTISSLTLRRWGVIITMMWYAMTCFFVLGAWESNIPVYSAVAFHYTPYNAGNFIALGGITAFPFLMLNVWYSRRVQDRTILALGASLGCCGILIMLATLYADRVTFGSFYICWALVALGFNLASTCTLSLLSKQLPSNWNGWTSLAIQYSNYTGRVTGAIWGGAGVSVGMKNYLWVQVAIAGIGVLMHMTLWRELKAKTG